MKRLMRWWIVGAICAGASAWSADFRSVPEVKGIIFLGSQQEFKSDGAPDTQGIVVKDLGLLQRPAFEKIARKYLGRPLDTQVMKDLQREVILYYRAHGRPIVDVVYRPQEISNGVIQVIVLEGRLNSIKPEYFRYSAFTTEMWVPRTNGWTSPKFINRRLRIKEGDVIDETALQQDLAQLNRNPLREARAMFSPTPGGPAELGKSDLRLRLEEQRPYQLSVGYEDTGTRATELDRLVAGFTWGRAFGQTDHIFNYQFIGDPSFESLRAHVASYLLPLPWHHNLRFLGYYLDAKADLGGGVTVEGPSYQTSFRYEIPLPYIGKYQHEASIGLDYKSAENFLALNEVTAADTPTEIFQLAAGYTGALRDRWGATTLGAQFYYSPGDVTDKNTDYYFNNARLGAEANYWYARVQLRRETRLFAGLTWALAGTAQAASGNLLPTEQLGFGGYASIRGYDDRQVNADEGWILSNEIWSPPFSPLSGWLKWIPAHDQMYLLAFYDLGEGSNIDILPNEDKRHRLSSVGAGLRYSVRKNLDIRFDYGWQLDELENSEIDSRGHISAVLRF